VNAQYTWHLAAVSAAMATSAVVRGDLLHFTPFENSQNVSTQGLHLALELITTGSTVDFIFRNDSTIPSVVTAIYIEANTLSSSLLQSGSIADQSPGVLFHILAVPPSPPGSVSSVGIGGSWAGNLFTLGAASPSPHNGLGPGDSVTVRFDLADSYQTLVQSLSVTPTAFRIVQHVQGLSDDASIWTVNQPIPAPGAGVVVLGGIAFMAGRRRRIQADQSRGSNAASMVISR
jgi:hypothetical protein